MRDDYERGRGPRPITMCTTGRCDPGTDGVLFYPVSSSHVTSPSANVHDDTPIVIPSWGGFTPHNPSSPTPFAGCHPSIGIGHVNRHGGVFALRLSLLARRKIKTADLGATVFIIFFSLCNFHRLRRALSCVQR